MTRHPAIILFLVVCSSCTDAAEGADLRTWTSKSGKYTVEAELLSLKQGVANLRQSDGKLINVPVSKLSVDDQDYVNAAHRVKSDASIFFRAIQNGDYKAAVLFLPDKDVEKGGGQGRLDANRDFPMPSADSEVPAVDQQQRAVDAFHAEKEERFKALAEQKGTTPEKLRAYYNKYKKRRLAEQQAEELQEELQEEPPKKESALERLVRVNDEAEAKPSAPTPDYDRLSKRGDWNISLDEHWNMLPASEKAEIDPQRAMADGSVDSGYRMKTAMDTTEEIIRELYESFVTKHMHSAEMKVNDVLSIGHDGDQWLATVSTTVHGKMKGEGNYSMHAEGFVVGFSDDNGSTWSFLDGSPTVVAETREQYPAQTKKMIFPQRKVVVGDLTQVEVDGAWVVDDAGTPTWSVIVSRILMKDGLSADAMIAIYDKARRQPDIDAAFIKSLETDMEKVREWQKRREVLKNGVAKAKTTVENARHQKMLNDATQKLGDHMGNVRRIVAPKVAPSSARLR